MQAATTQLKDEKSHPPLIYNFEHIVPDTLRETQDTGKKKRHTRAAIGRIVEAVACMCMRYVGHMVTAKSKIPGKHVFPSKRNKTWFDFVHVHAERTVQIDQRCKQIRKICMI